MKKILLIVVSAFCITNLFAQKPGYYNGTATKKGTELKTELHKIIKNHIDFGYKSSKFILEYAQEDPNNKKNLIQFYTGRSVKKGKDSWGMGGDKLNREHIWAKSHGYFNEIRIMNGDAHNLHAADASVNVTRRNYDFDNVPDGKVIEEADAKYSPSKGAFEPSDRDKGAVARTLFYMAVRYEGTDGELDLQMSDEIPTSGAKHGKLSTLLEWNRKFPPTDFERRRNERVAQSQGNRNPFIDYPEFADAIWGQKQSQVSSTLVADDVEMTPQNPTKNDEITLSINLTLEQAKKSSTISTDNGKTLYNNAKTDYVAETTTLYWGKEFGSKTYSAKCSYMDGKKETVTFSLNNFDDGDMVYMKLVSPTNQTIKHFSFYLAPDTKITPIAEVQGTGNSSPLSGKTVTISGIVTANFNGGFYMQSDTVIRSGICVYSLWRGHIGDSVTVTGKVKEYSNLTELCNVTQVYNYGKGKELKPVIIKANQMNEDYEGMFVCFENVNFVEQGQEVPDKNTTFTLKQGSNIINVYNRYDSRLVGQTLPKGKLTVCGIVSQYKSSYQLLLDNIDWATAFDNNMPPKIDTVIVQNKDFIEVFFDKQIKEECITANTFSIENLNIIATYRYAENSAYVQVEGLQKQEYTLKAKNIEDLSGHIAKELEYTFVSDITNGLSDAQIANDIKIYPIPLSNTMFVETDANISSYVIYNATGQVIKNQGNINKTKVEIPVANLPKGTYILKVKVGNQTFNKLLIK